LYQTVSCGIGMGVHHGDTESRASRHAHPAKSRSILRSRGWAKRSVLTIYSGDCIEGAPPVSGSFALDV
jgi:hypothetical protein